MIVYILNFHQNINYQKRYLLYHTLLMYGSLDGVPSNLQYDVSAEFEIYSLHLIKSAIQSLFKQISDRVK